MSLLRSLPFWVFLLAAILAFWAGSSAQKIYVVETRELDAVEISALEGPATGSSMLTAGESVLWPLRKGSFKESPGVESEIVATGLSEDRAVYELTLRSHRGIWALFPALVTILLCFLTREPVLALAAGVVVGALLLQSYDIPGEVLLPAMATSGAALVILLYLIFLGGLLGLWSRNGGALAFAAWVTRRFVRGPRTAKLAAWMLGVLFFQGGTISTLLVGTTVKPIADAEKVSHEELSFVVDSTASPIAILLPFNAWPYYVQGLIFVSGVAALATEASRIAFFFSAIPLSFYAILAVFFTLLFSFDKLPVLGRTFREAIRRARETGKLDRPGAIPLQSSTTGEASIPQGYVPAAWEFLLPLSLIISIAVGTHIAFGSPNVLVAFAIALAVAFFGSRIRGMSLSDLMSGFNGGLQSVVYGAVILLLAVVIGGLSRETGGGLFLAELLGDSMPPVILPAALFLLAGGIAFSTGTSWGTFAVTLPLAMPLAWATATSGDMSSPLFFLQICFAAVINGSVFGDQCSPISDTTVLSSIATGCDLMDHVRTQIVPCSVAAVISIFGWSVLTFFTL